MNLKAINIDAEIVISTSHTKYLTAVTSDFEVTCEIENNTDLDFFIKTLQKKKKARIKLHAKVYQNELLALNYEGAFVAIMNK